jgi:hypothetical protein
MRQPDPVPEEKPAPAPEPTTEPEPATSDEFESYTVAELRDYAKDIGLSGVSTLNKADLIAAIRAHEG